MTRAEHAEMARRAWRAAMDLLEATEAGILSPELADCPEPVEVLLEAQAAVAMGAARTAMRHTLRAAGGPMRG